MAYTTMSITDPATGATSVLLPRDGVRVMSLDAQPAVRAVANSVVGGDGTRDTTDKADAAAVTITFRLSATAAGAGPEVFLDELGAFLAPFKRPSLIAGNDQWAGPRQIGLRFDSKSDPVDNPISVDVAVSWKAPAGVWVATTVTEYDLPASVPAGTGLHFTNAGAHFKNDGAHFPASTSAADSLVTVNGTMRPPWVARLYGPCTGPKLTNDTSGGSVIFLDTLSLNAGEYVELNSAARTANFLSDPNQPKLSSLDFANTTWWNLEPGQVNQVRYHPTSGSASGAVLTFTPVWLP